MKADTNSLRIGILAEDKTDCVAIGRIVRRVARQDFSTTVGIDDYSGKGCSRLRRKAESNIKALHRQGCIGIIIIHDLDRNPNNGELNDESLLRAELENIEFPSGLQRLICIPVEELEAWFWSDPKVIQQVGRGKGEARANPHSIKKPKEELIRLSLGGNRKPRYSTNDNADLADLLNIELCSARCASFRSLVDFTRALVSQRKLSAM